VYGVVAKRAHLLAAASARDKFFNNLSPKLQQPDGFFPL
jgi:hypothetical protein